MVALGPKSEVKSYLNLTLRNSYSVLIYRAVICVQLKHVNIVISMVPFWFIKELALSRLKS